MPNRTYTAYPINPKSQTRIHGIGPQLYDVVIRHHIAANELVEFGAPKMELYDAIVKSRANRLSLSLAETAHLLLAAGKWTRIVTPCAKPAISVAYANFDGTCTLYGVPDLPAGCYPPPRKPPKRPTIGIERTYGSKNHEPPESIPDGDLRVAHDGHDR